MKKFLLFIIAVGLAANLSAEGRGDKKSVHVSDVTVFRDGNAVVAGFDLQVGRKVTRNNRALVITPVLQQGDRQVEMLPVVVQGKRAAVSRESRLQAERQWPGRKPYYTRNGNSLAYSYTFPYEAWMQGAELRFDGVEVTYGASGEAELGLIAANLLPPEPIRTEDPVVTPQPPAVTEELPAKPLSTGDKWAQEFTFVAPVADFHEARKTPSGELFDYDMALDVGKGRTSRQQADVVRFVNGAREGALAIRFGQGRRTINRELGDNNRVLVDLITAVRAIEASDDSRVVRVVIAGFASPEGLLADNEKLAWDRAVAVRDFFTNNSTVNPAIVYAYNGSVDWEGLRKLVAASDMAYKERVLDILDNTPIWDGERNVGRHGELMRLAGGEPYKYMLAHFFPQLRQAAYIKVYYENLP